MAVMPLQHIRHVTQWRTRPYEGKKIAVTALAFARLEQAPAYKLVFDAIEGGILSGRLQPGDPLPAETALARQFGVNRSTVREGIRLLEQAGLVARSGGKRLKVTLPHYMELASRASRALVLHQVTFRELWEAAMAVEPVAAGRAAQRIQPETLAALARNLEEMRTATDDVERFVRLDIAFHDLVAQASGNRVLALAREPIGLLFLPAGRVILPRLKTFQRVIDAHTFIYEALNAGDRATAERWMTLHMTDFKRAYELTGYDLDAALDSAGQFGGTPGASVTGDTPARR